MNMMSCTIVLLFAVVVFSPDSLASVQSDESNSYNYMAIIDAGSSGSRVYVYKWISPNMKEKNGVPEVEEVGNMKQKPGLSEFADNPAGVKDQLVVLIKKAKELVPENKHATTSMYLMGTAGLRLVEYAKREAIFVEIHKLFQEKTFSPFVYNEENFRILPGEEEGVFSWIALNYNNGFFQSDATEESFGLLEMGGASMQVAFIPDGQILANEFTAKVGINDYSLYIHSYLYYGQDYMAKRIRNALHLLHPAASVLDNPCMLQGDSKQATINGQSITYHGSGNPTQCREILRSFIWKVEREQCYPSPCTIGNTYQSPFGEKTFYAIKGFVYTPSTVGGLYSENKLSLQDLQTQGSTYCERTLDAAVQQIGEDHRDFASDYCMMSQYIPILLHDGLGFPMTGKNIIATNEVNGNSVSWTRGAVLYEIGKTCAEAEYPPL